MYTFPLKILSFSSSPTFVFHIIYALSLVIFLTPPLTHPSKQKKQNIAEGEEEIFHLLFILFNARESEKMKTKIAMNEAYGKQHFIAIPTM